MVNLAPCPTVGFIKSKGSLMLDTAVSDSGATTGGNGGSRLRAPLERGRRVQTAMFFYFV